MVEVRAAAGEARAEVAKVAEAAGKAALIYSARANASVDQAKVAVVVAVAVAAAVASLRICVPKIAPLSSRCGGNSYNFH